MIDDKLKAEGWKKVEEEGIEIYRIGKPRQIVNYIMKVIKGDYNLDKIGRRYKTPFPEDDTY